MPLFNNILAGAAGQGGAGAGHEIQRSLRFNSGDSSNLYRTATAGNRQTFTLSWWMKRCVINESTRRIFGKSTGSQQFSIMHDANGRFYTYFNLDSPTDTSSIVFAPQYIDPGAWAHYCLAFDSTQATDSNRIKFYYNGVQVTDFEGTPNWPTQNASFKWNNAGDTYYIGGIGTYHINAYLADIHHVDGQQLDCTSFGEFSQGTGVWNPIAYSGTYGNNGFNLDFSDNSSVSALGNDAAGSNNWTPNNFEVNSQVYATNALTAVNGVLAPTSNPFWIDILPTNADMHYASSTNTDNMKLVHDGLTTTSAYWVGNLNSPSYGGNVTRARFDLTSFGTITSCRVYGGFVTGYVNYKYRMLDSSKTEISGSEGTFGGPSWHTMQVTGSPKYIEISCEHRTSTNTRHRTYAIEVNGNVLVNGGPYLNASFFDTPTNYDDGTNVGGNYATWNPLISTNNLTNGNLSVVQPVNSTVASRYSTIGMSTGQWYWEISVVGYANTVFGVRTPSGGSLETPYDSSGYGMGWRTSGGFFVGGSNTGSGSLSLAAGDVLGMAFDADAGTLAFYKNGSLAHTLTAASSYIGETWFAGSQDSVGGSSDHHVNFGQRPFAISSVPTGFKPLCTQNLDDPLIAKGSDHFDVSLWTGNGQQMTVGGPIYSASADSGVTNAGKMFNGISNDGGYYNGTGTNKVITTTPFTIASQLRVYNNFRSDGTYAICLNDSCIDVPGSGTSSANFRWSTIDLSSFSLPLDVTKLGYSLSQNSGNTIALIEVDGNVLIDGNGDPLDFSPDLVWLKSRSTTAYHMVFDTMRGVEARLHPNTTSASQTGNGDLTAFNSNGYTLDNATGSTNTDVNGSGTSYVGWSWEGGNLATGTYSSYDQSQNWIANTNGAVFGGVIEDLFDTATSTGIYPGSGGASGTFDVTLTFSPGIACTSLRVYTKDKQSSATGSVSANGGTHQSVPGNDSWATLTAPSTLNSLVLRRVASSSSNNAFRFTAIEVNGKILIGPGVIPAGGLNSSIYNQSQTWSGLWSGTAGYGSFTNLHDADDTDYAQSTNATLTFSSAIALNSLQIRHSSNFGTATLSVNGTDVTSQLPTTGTKPLTTITGFTSLSSISMSGADYQANVHTLYEIFVNGKKLIDSGVSVADAPAVASTVRVNQSAGFSIVKVDNPTATESRAHGLNKKPDFIICKSTASADSWHTYHSSLGYTKYINLNSTSGAATSDQFGSQEPDSNLFYVKTSTGSGANKSGGMVYFIWTAVEGYSAFTSHTVRSGTNFVYLGFRPRFLMLKRTGEGSSTNMGFASWAMFDTERDTFNEVDFDTILYANVSHAEGKRGDGGGSTGGTYLNIDILSNGIRFQSGAAEFSQPNDVILVCAWAEHPLKYGRAR